MKKFRPHLRTSDAGTERHLSRFARRLSLRWKRLELPLDARLVVAVSGGADSTALLLALDELNKAGRLGLALKVAHLDHGLRGAAGERDARFVAELAAGLGYETTLGRASVGRRAQATRDNLEQAARRERYEFLGEAGRAWAAHAVAVAHTLDDQAETLLLALLRGSGSRGLGAMRERRAFDEHDGGDLLLVRPLLDWARRAETVEYCAARGVAVRADEMNEDEGFARVRVRRQLLPLLETFNPRASETLARTARLLCAEAEALERLGAELLTEAVRDARAQAARGGVAARGRRAAADGKVAFERESDALAYEKDAFENEGGAIVFEKGALAGEKDKKDKKDRVAYGVDGGEDSPPLSVEVLRAADGAVLSYALRGWIKAGRGNLRRIEAAHVAAVAGLLEGVRGGRVAELPGGARVERRRGLLLFHAAEKARGRV